MQFKPELAQLVVDGKKTQTRRLVKITDEAVTGASGEIEKVLQNGRIKWVVGKSMAIQPGRGMNQIGRKRLKSIRRQHVWDMTDADAIAEGIAHIKDISDTTPRRAFGYLWDSINKAKMDRWIANPLVWVLEFDD